MKFKKLTLAAAISIGLASVATVGAFADAPQDLACGCAPAPVVAAPACPCEAPLPVIVSPACPCEAPCASTSCDPCGAACPVPCCEPERPACGLAPNVCKDPKKGTEHYAYPERVFGQDNVTQADPFAIGLSEKCGGGVAVSKGCLSQPVLAENCGCNCGCDVATGAAAAIPCLNDCCSQLDGATVNRDCSQLEGATCPMSIKTETSMQATKRTMSPFQVPMTGAATPVTISSVFRDVPDGYWANCDINKLTSKNVIAGYPDRTFKPTLPVSRAEFASLIAHGLELSRCMSSSCQHFNDVGGDHWANDTILQSTAAGYMAGYPDCSFKPSIPVSRAEAITTISKAFKCDVSDCEADQILSQYTDGCQVPAWAKMAVAKALKEGVLENTLTPNMIKPCQDASRADVAAMLSKARVALCIDKQETGCACPCDCPKTAYVENEECICIPTLKVEMQDKLSSSTSNVGDQFAAKTVDPMVIDGVTYPACSRVNGVITDIQRPNSDCPGGMKIVLTEIQNGDCNHKLPRQILNAQVDKQNEQNWFSRTVEFPFALLGKTVGIVGRTAGGIIVNASNAAEAVTNGIGTGTAELFATGTKSEQCGCTCNAESDCCGGLARFRAAGRSYQDSLKALVLAPVDAVRTTLSGASGVLMNANDEVGYLVNPGGKTISSINMDEKVTFAFGAQDTKCLQPCEPCACAPCGDPCDTCAPAPAAPCCDPCKTSDPCCD